ncbi:MAG: hypothetical protein AAFQ51_19895 [Pseudomonadota bacterium]
MDQASTILRVAVAGTLPDVTMPDAYGVILVTEIMKLAYMVAFGSPRKSSAKAPRTLRSGTAYEAALTRVSGVMGDRRASCDNKA